MNPKETWANIRLPTKLRPKELDQATRFHSRYVRMLLDQDNVSTTDNILAAFFVWLLLASFIAFPGTFTTIKKSIEDGDSGNIANKAADTLLKSVRNIPLLALAAIMCSASVLGMIILSFRHKNNYIWVLNKLFLPGFANCTAGLISTLIGVYAQQKGVWSTPAKVTASVEGCLGAVWAGIWFGVDRFLLKKIKEEHHSHYGEWAKEP
ncbi:hypothetical protein ISF_09350 [Cordyceps fumosorosea ARSEF 2679]|uniref:Uncharacterized protein n=1 Tax=Cordyceps fumosorosea (strain ARSEF 2679) TaxID=1081104 RepID=A0A167JTI1_CORFA|nr:hypothetical protein ISF_09350 [Cordyceps fumosorosea ARSEF 2679]OAA50732.1 hypothetical protein ISF_09350 [Cordyceps fumosorosea ARSEF 2679]